MSRVPGARDRPYVVLHVAVSLDGATTDFEADVATFYRLVDAWAEDATLTGADTILAQEEALDSGLGPGPDPEGPLLVVVDSRRRVTAWDALRDAGHWSDVIALRSEASLTEGEPVTAIATGDDRVDLAQALRRLHRHHRVQTVRVDSGGALAGAMLDLGLIDEVSLLVHPRLVGSEARWFGNQAMEPTLALVAAEPLPGDLVWLRYRVSADEG